ncbi:MAG TPA: FAD-dependent oxidoreductase [Steroidobacteraceae bacterium]|nr:FAD-dependent oxidoreductase [Steroidobacteraceae bacterium]
MPTPLELDAPNCLYAATASAPIGAPELDRDIRAQILVVGGGYTGLSTALHLAELGRSVALLEAREPGFGAAGRNGGQVNAGLKYEPATAERMLGPVYGSRLVRIALRAPDFLFALIGRLGIECEANRCGTLRLAHAPAQVGRLRESVEEWRRRGVPLESWTREQVEAATGSSRYLAGTFDPSGGSVNPLSLARGLARAAVRAGVELHASTRVTALEPEGSGWRARARLGTVRADRVVLATDGYTDDVWSDLKESVVPIFSAIIATAPLPPELLSSVLPGRQVVYEAGNVTVYYRRDGSGRLLMGGRGPQRRALSREHYGHLVSYAHERWPALERIEWTHWWNGQFAVTSDFLPRFHMPAPGLYILLGYSGRGVALSSALGAELASVLAGAPAESFVLPVSAIRKMPFHRFWRLGVNARVLYGRLLDRLGAVKPW